MHYTFFCVFVSVFSYYIFFLVLHYDLFFFFHSPNELNDGSIVVVHFLTKVNGIYISKATMVVSQEKITRFTNQVGKLFCLV